MPLFVAFFSFRSDANPLQAMEAFERRKTFEHPPQANVLGEYWVSAAEGAPQVVLIWEADDEGPGDYYEAAWGDIFEITVGMATRPVTELPDDLPAELLAKMPGSSEGKEGDANDP
jgi:hypothetical protein